MAFGMLVGSWVIASPTAHAGAASCISSAEAANPGLSVTVSLGGTPQLVATDLNDAFDKIAQLHADPSLDVSFNAAGEQATSDAMDCMFSANEALLSTLWLNDNVSAVAQAPNTVRAKDDATGATLWVGELSGLVSSPSGAAIRFVSTTSADCMTLSVASFSAWDYHGYLNPASTSLCTAVTCQYPASCSLSPGGPCRCLISLNPPITAGGSGACVRSNIGKLDILTPLEVLGPRL
ncbi:MAG: hypothetical protein AAF078_14475 [Planctomycetota bacterium]